MARAVEVKHIQSGVRKCLKEDDVGDLLYAQAVKAAAQCNSMMSLDLKQRGAAYVAERKALGFSAGAVVRTGGKYNGYLTALDNAKNNTLKKGCGV